MTKEEKTNNTEEKRSANFFNLFVNALYLTTSKAVIAFLIALTTFVATSQLLDVILLYTENEAYVVNFFKQGPNFDYRESEPLRLEVEETLSAILDYSLRYSSPDGFESPDTIRLTIQDAEETCRKQIESVNEILDYEILTGSVDGEYIANGFVSKSADGYIINKAAIESYYQKQRDELIESHKRIDDGYRAATDTINSLRSVSYAVFDRTGDRIITSENVSDIEQAQKLFSSKENTLMVFDSRNPYFVHGSLDDMSGIVEEIEKNYPQDFDIFVSFPEDMIFNSDCEKIESKYNGIYHAVSGHLTVAVIVAAAGLALTVLLLCLSGRRERAGAPKYALTDRLPNVLHIFMHLTIAVSTTLLVKDSVYLILNPHLNTEWLTIRPDFFVLRAEVCATLSVLFMLAAICCVKRHLLHKTLFKNTLIYKAILHARLRKKK